MCFALKKSHLTTSFNDFLYLQGMGRWMKQNLDHRPPQPSWNDNRDHFNFGDMVGNLADEQTHHLSGFHHNVQPSTLEDTFRFDNLSPDTEYEVKIQARNSYGWSDNEPDFVFKTSHRGMFSFFADMVTIKKMLFRRPRTFL